MNEEDAMLCVEIRNFYYKEHKKLVQQCLEKLGERRTVLEDILLMQLSETSTVYA